MVVSAADAVTGTLRGAILQGQFRPGDRILQERLAEDLGVSRQPVREALSRLQAEGLVTSVVSGGSAVCAFSEEHVQENYRLRVLLESEAARDAAGAMDASQISGLARLNADMASARQRGDPTKVLELNRRFHSAIWDYSGLPTLAKIVEGLWATITVAAPLTVPERASKSEREHNQILAAFRDRDSDRAAESMRAHILAAQVDFDRAARRNGGSPGRQTSSV